MTCVWIVFFSFNRSECYLVTIFHAALRGLVGIGGVVTRTAAAVGATARTTVTRTAVVGVVRAAAAVGAAIRPTIICGFCGFCVPFTGAIARPAVICGI